MLVQFSVGNFRSFRNVVTLTMVAAHIQENIESHIFKQNDLDLLKSAVVYGANASGKSNLIRAMFVMSELIKNSSKESQAKEAIPIEPYRLSTDFEHSPSHFEIIFLYDDVRYRYGFEVDRERVHREWLYHVPVSRERMLFERTEGKFRIAGPFKEGKGLEEKTRDNALFLSVVAQFNGNIAVRILNWFNSFNIFSGIQSAGYAAYTLNQLRDPKMGNKIINFIRAIDLGIEEIHLEQTPLMPEHLPPSLPDVFKQLILKQPNVMNASLRTIHKKYDEIGRAISFESFDMMQSESDGTQKMFALAGPIMDTLIHGKVLVVDELDARLHPNLTRYILALFNSVKNHHAQLIFNTQDDNLLESKQLRRDQIWFTEKDLSGWTRLYSLVEYKIRSDAPFRRDYLGGKYGAIPIFNESEEDFWNDGKQKTEYAPK